MILLTAAMEPELNSIKAAVTGASRVMIRNRGITTGRLFGQDVAVACTGVGKVQTAMNTQFIIDQVFPSAVIMSGIAGALKPEYRKGDIVVCTDFIQHDFDATCFGFRRGEIPSSNVSFPASDGELVRIALEWKGEPLKTARVLTGDQFITQAGSPEFSYMTEELGGGLVDMEGAAASTVAAVNELPFLLLRVVSDSADGTGGAGFAGFVKKSGERTLELVKHILERI